MSQNQKSFAGPVRRTLINSRVFNLTAPCPSAEGKWSSLQLHAANDGLNISVWTNDPQDANNQGGQIKFVAPLPMAFLIFRTIELVAAGKIKERSFKHEDFTFMGGKKSEKKVLISTLIIGKDENGVYISVRAYKNDRPRINFVFGGSLLRSYVVLDENGQPMPLAAVSSEAAISWATCLAKVLAVVTSAGYKHPEPKPQGGGNGGGGYSNGGNGNGGGNAAAGGSEEYDLY